MTPIALTLIQMSLLATLLINSSPLLNARVVALEFDARVGREVEDMLHGFPVWWFKKLWLAKVAKWHCTAPRSKRQHDIMSRDKLRLKEKKGAMIKRTES